MNFQKILNRAANLINLPQSKFRHFTFIMKRNRVISYGFNLNWKTHPLAQNRYRSLHSEIMALTQFPHRNEDYFKCQLVNVRLNSNLELRLSKPCGYCQSLLAAYGFRDIWYTTNSGFNKL